MKTNKLKICTAIIAFLIPVLIFSQGKKGPSLSNQEVENYKQQVTSLVNYFEGTLNFIGNPNAVSKEKEIIINESYLKIFENDKVQIEDDLIENREVPVYKNVQAYLKDIEFFFRSVSFKLIVSDISFKSNDNNLLYFVVTLNRDLQGTSIEGDSISNRKIRYMEINLDLAKNDLRIASLYTTKLNEKEEVRNWWNGLPDVWRTFLGGDIIVYDTIKLAQVRFISDEYILISQLDESIQSDSSTNYQIELPPERQQISAKSNMDSVLVDPKEVFRYLSGILKQTTIDISDMENVRTVDPLSELTDLVDVNCSNTLVTSLFPLRNLNSLEILDCSNTPVDDLTSLSYSSSIRELDCSYTLLEDLSAISGLYNLEKLKCSGLRINNPDFAKDLKNLRELNLSETNVYNIESIQGLEKLEKLNISGTGIRYLELVSSFKNLQYLNCEKTSVSLLDPLKSLEQLEILKISYTGIETLEPIYDLTNLSRIYWDSDDVFEVSLDKKRKEAINFMKKHPGTLVIFESEALLEGWTTLEEPWRKVATEAAKLNDNPSKEELHALLKLEELNLEGSGVSTIRPFSQLYNLKKVSLKGLQLEDFSQLGDPLDLEYIDLSASNIKSLEPLKSLDNLKEVNISGTKINDLSPLNDLKNLETIYADSSGINDDIAFSFRKVNDCNIVYKSNELNTWWNGLSAPWQKYFSSTKLLASPPETEQLHELLFLENIEILNNQEIKSLECLKIIKGLKIIKLDGLSVSDISTLSGFKNLTELYCSRMPVADLAPLSSLRQIEVIDIENTPVEDLKSIMGFQKLRVLKVSGTQIKSLKPVSELVNLEQIELNNTQVKNISPLFSLEKIKSVSCFNSKISAKNIEKFKAEKPECKVVYY